MMFNVLVEWFMVNMDIPIEHDTVVHIVLAVTLIAIIASVVLRFKFGCQEGDNEQRNSNGDAS